MHPSSRYHRLTALNETPLHITLSALSLTPSDLALPSYRLPPRKRINKSPVRISHHEPFNTFNPPPLPSPHAATLTRRRPHSQHTHLNVRVLRALLTTAATTPPRQAVRHNPRIPDTPAQRAPPPSPRPHVRPRVRPATHASAPRNTVEEAHVPDVSDEPTPEIAPAFRTARSKLPFKRRAHTPRPLHNSNRQESANDRVAMRATRAVLHSSKRPRASQQPRKQTTGDKDIPEIPGVDEKLVETIIHTTLDRSGAVAWTDISGLEHAKKCIRETIIWPMLRPDIFTGLRTPPRGLLLFGPPGTGKTLIGKAIASQCSATFFSISASTMVSKWAGEGEKTVRALFEVARHMQPSVVFIDEIDSLLCSRSEGEQEFTRRIKTEFLVQMDGVGCSGGDRVLVIGATNRPQELDEAARRRLTKRLYIPLPDTPARAMLVKVLMKRQENSLQEHDYGKIACMTAGYSGSDMYAVCAEAALGGVREVQGGIGDIDVGGVRGVEMKDFVDACRAVRASVGGSELGGYRDWNERFGSYPVMEEMEDAQGHGDGDANAMES